MASTRRLPSGKYQGRYRDGNGKPQSAGVFPREKAALKAAIVKEEASRTGGWRDPAAGERPWGDWCEEWWPTRKLENSTEKNERSALEQHIMPKWGETPLGEITRQDGRKWIAELKVTERAPTAAELKRREELEYKPVVKLLAASTVQRIFGIFSASLMAAVDAEIIQANPLYKLALPQRPPAQERYLTKAEYQSLDAVLDSKRDAAIVGLLVGTGMRWGEAMGLHTHRIDRERGMIHIVETWDSTSGQIKPYPKGKLARSVSLESWVAELLDELGLSETASCGHVHAAGRCRSGLALHGPGRMTILDNWRKRVWTPATKLSKLDPLRPHDLRHTYASWLLQAGVSLAEVSRLLGHASQTTTQRYAHLAELPVEHVSAALRLPSVRTAGHATDVPQTEVPARYTGLRLVQ
ncbi:Site-specific recombinase XerD [Arthrobacter alpinus]|uniref:Site-specific recombinase XerD n=1 Tax=Arthrobacter alpinus TaxID=656366 RepID=A0A1H5H9Z6_9MICC|nr:site-specific integrase [Arthrobacter alpinus]SEE24685.1 Site-specific recombinase XerD [Arthrobacter alpinus]